MSKQITWFIYSGLALAVAMIMKYVGDTNRNLSELQDVWYIPLPLAVILYMTALKKGKTTDDTPDTSTPDSE
tara:strand:+ start:1299 stop:1514 length:216 start_codon:yes stop_codon:yes gene_type:complete